jgi:signal transduction histidine kinase
MRIDRKGSVPLSLRDKAIKILKNKPSSPVLENANEKSQSLIIELELHRIELELQNEELRLSQEKAEQSAEKYIEFYDFAPFGYFELSEVGEIIELNLSGASLLGSNRSNLMKSRFGFFVTDETKLSFTLFLKNIFSKKTKETCELILTPYNSEPIYVFLSGISIEKAHHCIVNVIDITQNKIAQKLILANNQLVLQKEEKEKRANELYVEKNKAHENARLKSAFLTNMNHEIRTPLNGTLDFSDLLKSKKFKNKERLKFIELIEESRKRLLNIANNLTEISKIESGITELSLSTYNINEQLGYIYSSFKPEVEKQGMHFFLTTGLSFNNAYLKSDRNKLYAIFTNLIINAIKHSDTGNIELGYFAVSKNYQKQLIFFVRDYGIGTLPENTEIIFKRFDKVINEQIRLREEAGLELSIARAYVELLGGIMWIESDFNMESTFYFTLADITETAMIDPDWTLIQELNQNKFKKN